MADHPDKRLDPSLDQSPETGSVRDLQDRISSLREESTPRHMKEVQESSEKSDSGKAYEMIVTPIVAAGLGAGLDHLFSTRPFFFLALAFLGVCGVFWSIYKAEKNISTPIESKRLQNAEKQDKKSANFDSDI